MSNYNSIKAIINANVKTNGKQEVTGSVLNSVLNAMVDSLGAGYQFMGVATPTNPGSAQTPDYKCFYLATTPGTYTYLGGLVLADGEVALLKYDSSWTKEVTGIASADKLNQLGQQVIYDVTANNADAKFASLSALLSSENLSTLIPSAVRCGGMSIRFVQTSDNKYVQYRCMAQNFTTDVTQWQGVDEEPTAGSDNLVKSGSVFSDRLSSIGNTFPALFDNRYSFADNGAIRSTSNFTSYGLMYNFSLADVYSITMNTDYKFELLGHRKSDNTFIRLYWTRGTKIVSQTERNTYDYARIRVTLADGSKPDFDTLISNNGFSVQSLSKIFIDNEDSINISYMFPTGGTGGTNVYTLEDAINKVPNEYKKGGLIITFKNGYDSWVSYILNRNDWGITVRYWKQILFVNNAEYISLQTKVNVLYTGNVFVHEGVVNSGTVLFDSDSVKEGDIINYFFSNEHDNTYSSNCAIAFFNSDNTRISFLSIQGATSIETKSGTYTIPTGFSYAKAIWDKISEVSITKRIVKGKDIIDLQNRVTDIEKVIPAIQENVLYFGNYTENIPAGTTSINRLIFTKEYTSETLPKKLCLKLDSVSDISTATTILRIDCYYGTGSDDRNYRYYYIQDIGNYAQFDIPNDTIKVNLVACIRCLSSESVQTMTFNGIVLALTPSKEKYALKDVYDNSMEFDNDVYSDEVKTTAATITEKSAKPCLVYNIMTDSHEDPTSDNSKRIVNNTLRNIQRVSNLAFADGAVHIGDILTPNNAALYPTWEKVNEHLDDFIGRFRKVNRECFVCIGNHDGLQSNYVNEFYTYGSMEKFNESYVVREGIAPWYYKDYAKIKTRVAFLAQPCRDLVESGEIAGYQINQNQMRWIADTVFNVEDGWNVLFLCHIHPYSTWGADSRVIFEGLTNAFCNHTTYQYNDWNINVDYSAKTHSKVLAFICGHTHADAVITDNSVFSNYNLEYPIICIASSNMTVGSNSQAGYTNPTRNQYSVNEDLWDTMVYRPDLNKIYMIRFGAGEDREINV